MPKQGLPAIEQASDTEPKRRLSGRVQQAVALLVSGECKTQKAAAERLNLNAEHLCRMLQTPQARVFIERQTRSTIAAGQMRAGARLLGLLDAASEHVSLDASKYVLALGGIKPAETAVSVNVELKAGFVIDISDRNSKPVIDITTT